MKIEYEKPRQVIHFAALDVGTVFRDPSDDMIYMKTEYIDNAGDEINAIDLATGNLECLHNDAKVYPVDATLYINEQKY